MELPTRWSYKITSESTNSRTAAVYVPAALLLYIVGPWVGGSVGRVLYVLLLLQSCCGCSVLVVLLRCGSLVARIFTVR